MNRSLTIWASASLMLVAASARADVYPGVEGFWLPSGISLGIAGSEEGLPGFVVGAEVSLVAVEEDADIGLLWGGVVADAQWDFGAGALRHRLGLEYGMTIATLELAYLGATRDGYRPGMSSRLVLTLPFVSIYGGYGYSFGGTAPNHLGETGMLLKVPIPLVGL